MTASDEIVSAIPDSALLRSAVSYAMRAPSSHNSQPWRFRVRAAEVELYADPSRLLRVIDQNGRELAISCGAALRQLRCALEHHGWRARVHVLPVPGNRDLLARVRCERDEAQADDESSLFQAIGQRQTHRGPFASQILSQPLLDALQTVAQSEAAHLTWIKSGSGRALLADLIADGDRLQYSDPAFRRELASWMRHESSPFGDGLAGYRLGLGAITSRIAPLVIRNFNLGRSLAKTDRKLIVDAPATAILSTEHDTLPEWIAAGQALSHVLLRAAMDGVSAGFMNQPVQCSALRSQLNALLDRSGFAQVVLRFGHAKLGRPSPRRALEDVLD